MSRPRRPALSPRRQHGLSLIELMIAITIGLLLLVAVGALFVYATRSNRQSQAVNAMQDQARFALSTLSRDIAMAGYWGGMASAANIITTGRGENDFVGTGTDCGPTAASWAFQPSFNGFSRRIEFHDQSEQRTRSITSRWRCLGNAVTTSDVVALRRVAGQPTASMLVADTCATLSPMGYFLSTNRTVGQLIHWTFTGCQDPGNTDSTPPAPQVAPKSFLRYLPRIYFVRDFSRTPGDGIPALCRKELCQSGFVAGSNSENGSCSGSGGNGGFFTQCLADGVEDLQIVWGVTSSTNVDPANPANPIVNYISLPSDDNQIPLFARSAQIYLRLRSLRPDAPDFDTKTYTMGNSTFTGSGTDKFYRRVYSTTVVIHNPVR